MSPEYFAGLAAVIALGLVLAVLAWRDARPAPAPVPGPEPQVIRLAGPPCPAAVRFGVARPFTEFATLLGWRGGALRVRSASWGPEPPFFSAAPVAMTELAEFVVESVSESHAQDALDADTQRRVRRLAETGGGALLVAARPGLLVVRVGARLTGAEQPRFVSFCYALLDRLAAAAGTWAPVAFDPATDCGVCGASIGPAGRVACAECRGPHHAACWERNDGCSSFGCGGRRSVGP